MQISWNNVLKPVVSGMQCNLPLLYSLFLLFAMTTQTSRLVFEYCEECVTYQNNPTKPHALAWVPQTIIQKYFSSSATDWKSMKKLPSPCKFWTNRFSTSSPVCYVVFSIILPRVDMVNPDIFITTRFVVIRSCWLKDFVRWVEKELTGSVTKPFFSVLSVCSG